MLRMFPFLVALLVISGCSHDPVPAPQRVPFTLEELAISVRGVERVAMLSDRHGAFFTASLAQGRTPAFRWTVDGSDILDGLLIVPGAATAPGPALDSAVVLPYELRLYYAGGISAEVSPVEGLPSAGMHGLAVVVHLPERGDVLLTPRTSGVHAGGEGTGEGLWRWPAKGTLRLSAEPGGTAAAGGLSVAGVSSASFLMVWSANESAVTAGISGTIDSSRRLREARMVDILNRTYLRTSDPQLTKATAWMKLSLDALTIAARDTAMVSGLPWDGTFSLRDNGQALAGAALAAGDQNVAGAMLRSMARWLEPSGMAGTVRNGAVTSSSADVTPLLTRQMYEYVAATDDTAMVRRMYPLVARNIEQSLRNRTDRRNFLLHGERDNWMGVARGTRTVESQVLWYYQQLIGSFMAANAGDTLLAMRWQGLADKTLQEFAGAFIDTTTDIICDHLASDGTPSSEIRPNSLLCLDVIGEEAVKLTTIRKVLETVVYPHGVGTLDSAAAGFLSEVPEAGNTRDGFVATWLLGPLTYAVSRYDRQDLAYTITEEMTRRALETDMVGTLPSMFEASPREGEIEARPAGLRASLSGMAEYVRSLYQDYFGVRYDVYRSVLTLQPKLPDQILQADFTVYGGGHTFFVEYDRRSEPGRVVVASPDISRDVRISFIWMMQNGDAWRGSIMLPPAARVTLAMGQDEILAYLGETSVPMESVTHLKHFSMRDELSRFHLAEVPEAHRLGR